MAKKSKVKQKLKALVTKLKLKNVALVVLLVAVLGAVSEVSANRVNTLHYDNCVVALSGQSGMPAQLVENMCHQFVKEVTGRDIW